MTRREPGRATHMPSAGRAIAQTTVVLAVVAIVFLGALDNGFVDWDDGPYIVHNPMVADPSAFAWSQRLLTPDLGYPLPVVVWIYGLLFEGADEPLVFHAFGVLVHLINVGLVMAVVRRHVANVEVVIIAGLAFGCHPIVVEPVVWASGLKDTLMLTAVLVAMAWFERRPGIAAGCGVLAMACKPAAALVGLALVALAVRGRACRGVGAVAWLVVIIGVGYAGFVATSEPVALRTSAVVDPTVGRVLGALGMMVEHVLVPANLSPRYPVSSMGWGSIALGAVAISLSGWAFRRLGSRHVATPWIVLAWALYLPVSNVRPLERFTADSYAYAVWAAAVVAMAIARVDRWFVARWPRWPRLRRGTVAAALLGWAGLSVGQVEAWSNTERLWASAMDRYSEDGEVIYRYGDALGRQGEPRRELALYLEQLDALATSSRIPAALLRWYAHQGDVDAFDLWARRALESPVRQDDAVYVAYVHHVVTHPERHVPALDLALRYAYTRWRAGTLSIALADDEARTFAALVGTPG